MNYLAILVLLSFSLYVLNLQINIAVYNIQIGINMNGKYNLSGTADTISRKLEKVEIIGIQEVGN